MAYTYNPSTWVAGAGVREQLGMVVHICNLSYLGGRDQEEWGLRPALAKSSWDPISTSDGEMACTCYRSYVGKHK
jgi:hypothetical protein